MRTLAVTIKTLTDVLKDRSDRPMKVRECGPPRASSYGQLSPDMDGE